MNTAWLVFAGSGPFALASIASIVYRPSIAGRSTFYHWHARLFGVTKDNYTRRSEIQFCRDSHGKVFGFSKTTTEMRVRAVSQDVPQMEYRYRIPDFPGDASQFIDIQLGDFKHDKHSVKVRRQRNDVTTSYYVLTFSPSLKVGESLIIPLEGWSPPGSFACVASDLVGRDYEYSMIAANYPSDSLTLRVTFPPHYQPTVDLAVWFNGGRVQNTDEMNKLKRKKCLTEDKDGDGRLFAELRVEHPIPALQYAVIWKLPYDLDPRVPMFNPPPGCEFKT